MSAIYNPEMHEPLDIQPWDASKARDARDAIVRTTLDAAARGELWPAHPMISTRVRLGSTHPYRFIWVRRE
jgi:hypothetical protein